MTNTITVNEILNEDNINQYTEAIDTAIADESYAISEKVDFPFTDFAEKQATRIVKGNLHTKGISVTKQDWGPFNLIVDGDLTVDSDIDWNEWGRGSFLFVTGSLRVKNLFMAGCPEFIVLGNLTADNGIVGSQGDNGGRLIVEGDTNAAVIYCTTYFSMEFSSRPKGKLIADSRDFDFDADLDESDYSAVAKAINSVCFTEEEGSIDVDEFKDLLREGKNVFA